LLRDPIADAFDLIALACAHPDRASHGSERHTAPTCTRRRKRRWCAHCLPCRTSKLASTTSCPTETPRSAPPPSTRFPAGGTRRTRHNVGRRIIRRPTLSHFWSRWTS